MATSPKINTIEEKHDSNPDGDFTSLIGEVRLWHMIILTVIFINSLFNAFGQLSMAFMAPNVGFTCRQNNDSIHNGMTKSEWLKLTQLDAPELLTKTNGYCQRRDVKFFPANESVQEEPASNSSIIETSTVRSPNQTYEFSSEDIKWTVFNDTVKCDAWDIDHSVHRATIIEQWSIICDRDYLRPFPQAVGMAGLIVGNLLASHISDRFGRQLAIRCGMLLCAISGLAATTTSNFMVFNIGRFFSSVSKIGIQAAIVIFLETTDASSRWMFSMLNGCGFHFGMILLSLTAYYGDSWRYLQAGIAGPCIVILPFLYFIWESPRWLLSKKRIDEGVAVIKRIAKIHGVSEERVEAQIPAIRERYNSLRTSGPKSAIDLLGSSGSGHSMTKISLIMWYLCFSFGILFYSAIFMSTSLGSHPHISFCIPVAGELCAIVLVALGVRFMRRRAIVFVTAMLGGIGFLVLGFTDKFLADRRKRVYLEMGSVILIRSSAAAFTQLYPVYSAELYPTPLRNVGIGFCDLMFRLASTVDPFGRYWLPRIHERLLPVLYASLGFTAAIFSLFLPETMNKELDDGIFGRLSVGFEKIRRSIRRRASIFPVIGEKNENSKSPTASPQLPPNALLQQRL